MAELEARKLKYPNTGTEAFLMGILVEGMLFPLNCCILLSIKNFDIFGKFVRVCFYIGNAETWI